MDHPNAPPESSTRLWPAVVATIGIAAVIGIAAAAIFGRDIFGITASIGKKGQTGSAVAAPVQLQPVTFRNPDSFTDSIVSISDDELITLAASASGGTRPEGDLSGDTSLLYATVPGGKICDRSLLSNALAANEQLRVAWADAAGVAPEQAAATVTSLHPVILRSDTAVTNHSYRDGSVSEFQAILQAGTPVLIDSSGTPRVQCSCGNPLGEPRSGDSVEFEGEQWDGFDDTSVLRVRPSAAPVDQVTALNLNDGSETPVRTTPDAVLDGYLVVDDSGTSVVDETGASTLVMDESPGTIFDDGEGGLVFTRGPVDVFAYSGDAEPIRSTDRGIWILRAGSTEAEELIAPVDSKTWNRLLAVGNIGGRELVVYARLHMEVVETGFNPTPTGDLVAFNIDSGEETILAPEIFGWESGVGVVSIAGNRLAFESGYSSPSWSVFDANLNRLESRCSDVDNSDVDFLDMNCPRDAVLDHDGNLVFLSSQLTEEYLDFEELITLDPLSGSRVGAAPLQLPGTGQESSNSPIQATADRIIAARHAYPDGSPIVDESFVVDRASGALLPFTAEFSDSTRWIWKLTAPLVRPASAPTTVTQPPTGVDAIDPLNADYPAAICGSSAPEGLITLRDGLGENAADPMSMDYVGIELDSDGWTRVDVDGDGTMELVMAPTCNWGGSGYWTPLVALTVGEDGRLAIVGEVLEEHGRGSEAIVTVEASDDATVLVGGGKWDESDALCCPSAQFEQKWRMDGAKWSRVS